MIANGLRCAVFFSCKRSHLRLGKIKAEKKKLKLMTSENENEFDNGDELDEVTDESFFKAVEYHLDDHQFRRKVMLFQRCDNVLRPILQNLEEINPKTDEEISIYKTFLSAAQLILDEMQPFFPDGTYNTLSGRLKVFENRMPQNNSPTSE